MSDSLSEKNSDLEVGDSSNSEAESTSFHSDDDLSSEGSDMFDSVDEDELEALPYRKNTINFRSQVFDTSFHPTSPLIVSGLITGDVFCHSYSETEDFVDVNTTQAFHLSRHHKKSCRGTRFSLDGSKIFTISKDQSYTILDTPSGKEIFRLPSAHEVGLSSIIPLGPWLMATGDDSGIVKLWDTRTNKSSIQYHEHEDFVSDMALKSDEKTLLSVGGDGFLAVMDIRKEKLIARSDNMEEELLSVAIVKEGKKVVVGTQDGVLDLFSWGDWGDLSDRYPGHPESIESIVKLEEDVIVTGSSDGLLRVVNILPNKLIGVLGNHGKLPIERLDISHNRHHIASCSHDRTVKFWPIHSLLKDESSDEESDEAEDSDLSSDLPPSKKQKGEKDIEKFKKTLSASKNKGRGFFDDL